MEQNTSCGVERRHLEDENVCSDVNMQIDCLPSTKLLDDVGRFPMTLLLYPVGFSLLILTYLNMRLRALHCPSGLLKVHMSFTDRPFIWQESALPACGGGQRTTRVRAIIGYHSLTCSSIDPSPEPVSLHFQSLQSLQLNASQPFLTVRSDCSCWTAQTGHDQGIEMHIGER